MLVDNYVFVGIYLLTVTGWISIMLHGVYVGFMSRDYRPSEIPESAKVFLTHEQAAVYADELETEYGVSFLCDCTDEDEKVPVAEWEKERLYPATKKTVRQVIKDYADILDRIYRTRTAGDFTWKGVLHDFMSEVASAEDE